MKGKIFKLRIEKQIFHSLTFNQIVSDNQIPTEREKKLTQVSFEATISLE